MKQRRKSLAFTPKKIPGLVLWSAARFYETLTFNGGKVSQVLDKSGTNNYVIQSTASKQPTYVASGINGLPTFSFDGAQQTFVRPTFTNFTPYSGWTAFVVIKHATGSIASNTIQTFYNNANDEGGTAWQYRDTANVETQQWDNKGGLGSGVDNVVDSIVSTPQIWIGSQATSTKKLWINRELVENDTPSTVSGVGTNYGTIGSMRGDQRFWNGYISEWGAYNRVISVAEALRLQKYLNNLYRCF